VDFSKTPAASHTTKKVIAGKTFTFRQSIKNTGSNQLKDLYFQVELPAYLVPVKATVAPKYTLAGGPGVLMENQYVVFHEMQLPVRKKLKVKVTIGVKSCQPSGNVQIKGIAFQLGVTGQVVCSSEMTPYPIIVVRKKKVSSNNKWGALQKHATWDDDDCTTPTPAPSSSSSPYNMIGENQRCLEAKLLDSRRRLETIEQQEHKGQEQHEDRELANTYTPDECYQACAGYLQVTTTPYYFNLDTSGQCYCCQTCLGIYDLNFTVS
jgi:hypothetical protein